jgi:IPT/TIG domain
MKIGCSDSDLLADQQREDKLVHIMQNKYYGHPNPKRATHDNDPRQCVWRNPTEPTSASYEAPIGVILSSATGIIEYKADHFNRQLRGNLIFVKYKSGLRRTVLSSDGLSANPLTIPGIALIGTGGLDVTQAPNGNLIEVRYITNSIFVDRPVEAPAALLKVSSVFPSRGGVAGGTILRVYGSNFGVSPTINVGSRNCPIVFGTMSAIYMECTLPGGRVGLVDVSVTSNSGTYVFQKGYRYITGTGF